MPRLFHTVSARRAGPGTTAAALAGSILVLKLSFYGNCFGVMTPLAQKATAFKKDRGTDAGTVVKGKTLNIGNNAPKGIRPHGLCWLYPHCPVLF
jgi:hypothetical protein